MVQTVHGQAGFPDNGLLWTDGRYFPEFPPTNLIYSISVPTVFEGQDNAPFDDAWRINQDYDTMMALTLVGMQGVINRSEPKVYLNWDARSDFWLPYLREYVDVVELNLDSLSAIHVLFNNYSGLFSGAVIYDPEIPDTINLATMIAGLENRIMLTQFYH